MYMIMALLLLFPSGTSCCLGHNIPPEVRRLMDKRELRDYETSTRINPFYLRGDFDGDSKTDLAVLVVERKTGRRGIAIIHPAKDSYVIIGAGEDFLRSDGYNYKDFGFKAWSVYSERHVVQAPDEGPPPKLLGEAILVEWPEAGSGLIYWDGSKYRWYHLGG